jgi:nucleoside triphosphate diphosphatase
MSTVPPAGAPFEALVEVVARLRTDCPWDRAQTWASLRPYVLEEAYELCEALDRGRAPEVRKELGDVLFQVLLLARIGADGGHFGIDEVVRGTTAKMVERHPHVFDESHTPTAGDVGIVAWEARKARERREGSTLDGVPDALPALLRAHRVSEKASRVGFDWPNAAAVREKIDEELAELDEAIAREDAAGIEEELGDLLFALVNLGRHLPVSAEDALRTATRKFEGRFRSVEASLAAEGRSVHEVDLVELEARWQAAKRERSPPDRSADPPRGHEPRESGFAPRSGGASTPNQNGERNPPDREPS